MTTRPPLPPDVQAMLESEREIPAVSAVQRARALARARKALEAPRAPATSSARVSALHRWVAAAAALVASVGLAAAAYELHEKLNPAPASTPAHRAMPRAVASAAAAPVAVASEPALAPAAEARPAPAREATRPDAIREELRLLRQARADVAREDFLAALRPITEHARRFKDGRLAEEREALRVKVLAGLGRGSEAHRAATAFEARFPRSVLLPAVRRMAPAR
jgi:hypothetical protein